MTTKHPTTRATITPAEQDAISAWLEKNQPTICPPATMSWQLQQPEEKPRSAPPRQRQSTGARVLRRRDESIRLAQMQEDRAAGMTIKAIAEKHGLLEQTVSRILRANVEASGARP